MPTGIRLKFSAAAPKSMQDAAAMTDSSPPLLPFDPGRLVPVAAVWLALAGLGGLPLPSEAAEPAARAAKSPASVGTAAPAATTVATTAATPAAADAASPAASA
ncbi:MAG: hypothetical protein RIS90_3224, partial [Pseudomonadota bacterium]